MRLSDYTQSGGRGLFRRDRRIFDQRGTFTFTIPEGVTQIWAFVMGAGGGAHHGESWNDGIIAGGAGGGYASPEPTCGISCELSAASTALCKCLT